MNEALARRLATMTGVAVAASVALWWLGSTRLALDHGSDASRFAADALSALWLVRAVAVATLGLRAGALRGWRPGAAQALGLIGPSWPLVVLVWSASTTPLMRTALAELLLLIAAVALPLVGGWLRRALRQSELAVVLGTAAGAALAASVWLTHGAWALPLS